MPDIKSTVARLRKELAECSAQLTRAENDNMRLRSKMEDSSKVKTPEMKFNSARASVSKEEIKLFITKQTEEPHAKVTPQSSHSKKPSVSKIELNKKVTLLELTNRLASFPLSSRKVTQSKFTSRSCNKQIR